MTARGVATRLARRHRRALAAASAGLSVLVLGLSLRPIGPATAEVVVVTADLPVGHRLTSADVEVARVAEQLTPRAVASDPGQVEGRVLAAPMAQGEPVTALRLADVPGGGWPSSAAGAMALPVRFADDRAAGLLGAGIRIDVLAAAGTGIDDMGTGSGGTARLVALDVLVLGLVPGSAEEDGMLGRGVENPGPLVLLEVTRAEALAIVGARAGGQLWFTLPGAAG
jgi:Flp pilus assembly protein CpaB